jgi:hypothetical protein
MISTWEGSNISADVWRSSSELLEDAMGSAADVVSRYFMNSVKQLPLAPVPAWVWLSIAIQCAVVGNTARRPAMSRQMLTRHKQYVTITHSCRCSCVSPISARFWTSQFKRSRAATSTASYVDTRTLVRSSKGILRSTVPPSIRRRNSPLRRCAFRSSRYSSA